MPVLVKYNVGDVVRMKKVHPCGGDQWEIMRTGVDFRIRCLKCGRVVMLPRPKFEKSVRSIISSKA
ncbi:MAG TPA: DUF951 domain-containing protein [Desulfotomaculum sp.]|nr:MAG: hypothetical protein XD84_1736 [Desulfotomaculum sp. 46_80]KUK84920.1 MAG: hypothetical protein XE00_0447 [Desulfofundulus kuznetsovii]HBY04229.1 DUF951 domain-containing protein [Desulfotomaculum sp.]